MAFQVKQYSRNIDVFKFLYDMNRKHFVNKFTLLIDIHYPRAARYLFVGKQITKDIETFTSDQCGCEISLCNYQCRPVSLSRTR